MTIKYNSIIKAVLDHYRVAAAEKQYETKG